MRLDWLGENRDVIEAIFYFSNTYAGYYRTPFKITEDIALSAAEIQVLEYLLENEEIQMNMAEIAHRLGVTPSRFTQITNKLSDMKLVEKYYQEGNKKNVIVLVSKKGKEVYHAYFSSLQEKWAEPVLKRLDAIPEEYKAEFAKVMKNLYVEN